MSETLRFIREEFGSLDKYLDKHGFKEDYRKALRRCLMKDAAAKEEAWSTYNMSPMSTKTM